MNGVLNIHTTNAAHRSKQVDENSKIKLQRAVQDFESMFVGYMLKNMRGSIPKSEMFGENFGGDILEGMFDTEFAKHISSSNSLGLAEMLYKHMTGESLPKSDLHSGKKTAAPNVQYPDLKFIPEPKSNSAEKNKAPLDKPSNKQSDQIDKPDAMEFINSNSLPVYGPEIPKNMITRELPIQEQKKIISNNSPNNIVGNLLNSRLKKFDNIIEEASQKHGIDSSLVRAVIAAESSGINNLKSQKDAKGLMQLIDTTASDMGVVNVWDPEDNIFGGAKYLSMLLNRFEGNVKNAVASYNAGPETVKKYNGIPPYKETRNYVEKVMNYFEYFRQLKELTNEED